MTAFSILCQKASGTKLNVDLNFIFRGESAVMFKFFVLYSVWLTKADGSVNLWVTTPSKSA